MKSFAQRRQEIIDAQRDTDREPVHGVSRDWSYTFTEVAAIIDHYERGLDNDAVSDGKTGRIANKQIGSALPIGAPSLETMRRRAIAGIGVGNVQYNDEPGWRGH